MNQVGFGARLAAVMRARGPLCVGIDPHAKLLADWGLPDSPSGLETFARTAVEALAPEVGVLKPQSAFFERHGSRGIAVLETVIATAREAGALVLLDVKRGDIGSTVAAYADAYLDDSSPLAVDAITASAFLGFGSLNPLFERAQAQGRGVFVLALTSNPEGAQVQRAIAASGRTVAQEMLAGLARANAEVAPGEPMGPYGAVVGATVDPAELSPNGMDALAINGPLLVPGLGAQGGTAEQVRRVFAGVLDKVLPSSSREVLAAGPDPDRLRAAARAVNDAFRAV